MTDDTTNTTDQQTETDDQQTTGSFSPEYRAKMKDMDHAPPVEGAKRTFERNNEQQPPQTDGGPEETGQRPETDESSADETADEAEQDGESMKEMDHSSPVEGPTRVFERGNETSDVSK